ncbi:hypothetical protein [Nocardia otitidiscaviarum]|uniref:hypothetical protein n=1 Tax=Nocardia otitidiscaviarum TaxID=1823 RepID=UPI001895FD97|nr:hypothetical protein [Nocardia otitidiscaviarum]MBF6180607.1 hypothetical protein [Nocardia otitidiscaviarum]
MRIGSDRNKKNEATAQETPPDDERLVAHTGTAEPAPDRQPVGHAGMPVDDRAAYAAGEDQRDTAGEPREPQHAADSGARAETQAPGDDSNSRATVDDSAQRAPLRTESAGEPLIADGELERLRIRWREVQGMFVDDPRDAVHQADELVGGTIQRLADAYADRRKNLETRWSRNDSGDTEELRQALRGYRSFFDQLLSSGR